MAWLPRMLWRASSSRFRNTAPHVPHRSGSSRLAGGLWPGRATPTTVGWARRATSSGGLRRSCSRRSAGPPNVLRQTPHTDTTTIRTSSDPVAVPRGPCCGLSNGSRSRFPSVSGRGSESGLQGYGVGTGLSKGDLGQVPDRKAHRRGDEALRVRLVMQRVGAGRVPRSDDDPRMKDDLLESAITGGSLPHPSLSGIRVRHHPDPVHGAEMKVPEHVAGGEGRDQEFFRIPASGISAERGIRRAEEGRPAVRADLERSVVRIVPIGAGPAIPGPLGPSSIGVNSFHCAQERAGALSGSATRFGKDGTGRLKGMRSLRDPLRTMLPSPESVPSESPIRHTCPICEGELSPPVSGSVHCYVYCRTCGTEYELDDPRLACA